MTKIMIEIKGGNLQGVTSTEPIEYLLLDYDNLEAGDSLDITFFEQDGIGTEEDMIKHAIAESIEFIHEED